MAIDLEQSVEVKWNPFNRQYYESKGYKFTKWKDGLMVKIKDLPNKSNVRIKYQCDNCRKTIEVAYGNYTKRKDDLCFACANILKPRNKIPFETVIKAFIDKGYTVMFSVDDYKGSKTKLKFICPSHGIQSISYDSIKQGHGCKKCGKESMVDKQKVSFKDVQILFNENKYILISKREDYHRASTVLRYLCSKHGEQSISYDSLRAGHGCSKCANENNSGENNCNFNPELTMEDRVKLRKFAGYNQWRISVYRKDYYTCQCCGSKKDIRAHHIQNYKNNKELRTEISNGITLCETCHRAYHAIYGSRHNTKDQLYEFIEYNAEYHIDNLHKAI